MNSKNPIIFFDGHCNLCNGFIAFIIRWDKKRIFKMASLQGHTAKEMLPSELLSSMDTVILREDNQLYSKSTAALKILVKLHWIFTFCSPLLIIPAFMRDKIYMLISKNRYSWFGTSSTCRIPTPEEKDFFLP